MINETEKRPLILIADDEPHILAMVTQCLTHAGYDAVQAANGQEAIDRIRTSPPQLILLDIKMPLVDGFQVCEWVKQSEAHKNIPVLLLTSSDQQREKIKGFSAGADDFINKPFDPAELLARVRAFLRSKELYDQLQSSYKKLKELEDLRDGLTSMIVHDLKAPLNVTYGTIQFIEEVIAQEHEKYKSEIKLMENAKYNCMIMTNLINDILDVSRLEEKRLPVNKKKQPLAQIIDLSLLIAEHARLKSRIEIRKEIEPGVPDLDIDEVLLQRVLSNILSNSIKFMQGGGAITVSLKRVPEAGEVECSIQDSGMGIPAKHLKKIFDKFFQGDDVNSCRKGQGMGLTFCKMAIEAHGGRIWAESEEQKGSKFIIRLPTPS